jgi:Domain of unknown function (DUF4190)
MSDVSQGPGWWQASDRKWYPPDAVPGTALPPPPPPQNPVGDIHPSTRYPGPSAPYSSPSVPYPVPSAPYPAPVGAYQRPTSTNGLAIASFVLSLLWVYGLGSILAIIFAIVSRKQIRNSRGTQGGDGLAIAGLIIGICGVIGTILITVFVFSVGSSLRNGVSTFNITEQAVTQCQADAAGFKTAVEAYRVQVGSFPPAGNGSILTTTVPLPQGGTGGPYLSVLPSATSYTIWTDGNGGVYVYPPSQTTTPSTFSSFNNNETGNACRAVIS